MANDGSYGAYVPTNFIWDGSQISEVDVKSDEFKELLVRLYQNLNLMQLNLNIKDSAYYTTGEFVCGQKFFQSPSVNSSSTQATGMRNVFRKVINFGALPNTASKSVAHEIEVTTAYTFTRMYGAGSDTTSKAFIAIPNRNIELTADATNVTVQTFANYSSYDTTYIVLEYLKQ